ncbi:MAG: 1-acyl-sn-glycerol-3-phosphate acyltransferase [Planctomycetes bacterium]|nr:1-acyl-sn-glycerol-3-phosphate acyltransferase [Planctomycetota bacterium]
MRKLWQAIASILWLVACSIVFFPPLLLFPTPAWRLRMAILFARWWSRGCLWLAGVRLVITPEDRARLRPPAIFTFNHASNLDFLINAVLAPHGSLVFGKRELARLPLLGWMWLLSGHPLIRRDDRDDWQRRLDEVATRLRTGRHATIIAPEGKRNHGAGLLPFKKGPFHLALQSRVPIVPWVILGAEHLLTPRGILPGTVRVRVLAPIPTTDWTLERLDEHVDALRRLYVEALGGAPATDDAAAGGATGPVTAAGPAGPPPPPVGA